MENFLQDNVKNDVTAFVVGARGYVGKALFAKAASIWKTCGTSSSGGPEFIPFRLEAPADFDFGKIQAGDIVFLTAAISSPDRCAREHDHAWAVNVTGTITFIDAAIARGARVIFFSSDTVYGEQDEAFDERMTPHPAGEYALMKHAVEQHFFGNPLFKSVRPSYVFSREDKFTQYLAASIGKNEKVSLFHPFMRAIVHRDDVVDGAVALAQRWLETPEQFINFGGPDVISRVAFVECLRAQYFRDLRYSVTCPDAEFFRNRPRSIAMQSPVLARLLDREPHALAAAASLEFAALSNNKDTP